VWDYDLPSAPILHDIEKVGKTIIAVTVLTKQGMKAALAAAQAHLD
jgi:glucose dehydrogenase